MLELNPGVNESTRIRKATRPRKQTLTLFQIVKGLIQRSPDDPVYYFMDKKRSEGKPYYVYMTAGANKFLRIYYGKVKKYLSNLPLEG